jgi:hypothetical protein
MPVGISKAVGQKEKYFLWWSFLQLLLTDPNLANRFQVKGERYERWGDVRKYTSFERWWQERGRDIQSSVVREVTQIPAIPPDNTIYLEVPLNRAPLRLAKRAKHIIQARFEACYPALKGSTRKTSGFIGETGFTENREIRVAHYRQLLGLHHAVFKNHPDKTGITLLETINAHDKKNAAYNESHPMKKQRPRFVNFTTWHLNEQQLKANPMFILEPWKQWLKRSAEMRASGDSDEMLVPQARVRRLKTRVADHLNYRSNKHVQAALRSLVRAKQQRDAVLYAVERGEFPGKSLYKQAQKKRRIDDDE